MTGKRTHAASVMVTPLEWWITGGYDSECDVSSCTVHLSFSFPATTKAVYSSTNRITLDGNGGGMRPLGISPFLPTAMAAHCLAKVDENSYLVAGGSGNDVEQAPYLDIAYFTTNKGGSWDQQPAMDSVR